MPVKFKSLNEKLSVYDDWQFVSKGGQRWIVLDSDDMWTCCWWGRSVSKLTLSEIH